MEWFGWIAEGRDCPPEWDLRRCGWRLCTAGDDAAVTHQSCRHVLLLDARARPMANLAPLLAPLDLRRTVVMGVEASAMRADLLARGCADVLPRLTGLDELAARARRAGEAAGALPRSRRVGPLLLDLFHRDARRDASWLGLHPREFGLLWRLAEQPGQQVTRRTLLHDVWRIHHEPETNSVEVHVSRLRGKLALAGCADLVRTAPTGGYHLSVAEDDGPTAGASPLPARPFTATLNR